jgi:AAHS family 4-hydroxybenzoate transporter-like MFS transporter
MFGIFGDRFGRRPALIAAVALFAATTSITPFTSSLPFLGIVRLVTGFGLGGALPIIWAVLPESVRFLAMKQNRTGIERVLERMRWPAQWDGALGSGLLERRWPVASLFASGKALGTVLLWTTLFLSLLLTYFLVNWMPIIARQNGIGMTAAVLAVAALNLGAIVGCLTIGRLCDLYGRPTIIIGCAFVTFLAGVLSIGAQMCTIVLCASFYETSLRATGVGWAIGIGRIGSIVGPVLGGVLIVAGTAAVSLFILVGTISIGSAIAIVALGLRTARQPVIVQ